MAGEQPNINKTSARLRILVAPLDWGLGHATRCIPVIRRLRETGAEVFLAGEGPVADLLLAEFPGITLLPLKGYRVRYSQDPRWFTLALFRQFPRIWLTIKREHNWLLRQQQDFQFDGIISDNRYGLFLPGIPSVLITHQLHIETGKSWMNRLTDMVNAWLTRRFSACWVPDSPGEKNLAGKLSHPDRKPSVPVQYLGPLSRMGTDLEKSHTPLLVILSGPEPQRSIFEKEIIGWLSKNPTEAVVVLGKPGSTGALPLVNGVRFFQHLPSSSLNELILGAGMVVARCGYSTVMDLAVMQKKAILIPTPGQTEQEYLASHLNNNHLFVCIAQDALQRYNLSDLHNMAEKTISWTGESRLHQVLEGWLSGL